MKRKPKHCGCTGHLLQHLQYAKFFLLNFSIMIILILLSGCAGTSKITNLTPALLYSEPSISTYMDPSSKVNEYRTFSVFPKSLLYENIEMNEILEKQILFYIRNVFEVKGYSFVELNQSPDFLVTIDVSSEYETSYVPPSEITIPKWVPSQTITTNETFRGSFNLNTYGDYSAYGWGNYSGSSSSTITLPGYMSSQTYASPGYTYGNYYPVASIMAFDGKTFNRFWLGTGAGASDNSDVRVSSQFVIEEIVAKFPNSTNKSEDNNADCVIGIWINIFTNDGNNYMPTVVSISEDSPAQIAGIKQFDMILEINETSVVNKPIRDAIKLLRGDCGTPVHLKISRTGQVIPIDVFRVSLQSLK